MTHCCDYVHRAGRYATCTLYDDIVRLLNHPRTRKHPYLRSEMYCLAYVTAIFSVMHIPRSGVDWSGLFTLHIVMTDLNVLI
jgi:hypothetical protein